MSGVVKINITESAAELHTLLKQQKTAQGKERVQALYLLKTGQVETVQHLAVVLGRGRITVQRWLRQYRQSGLEGLLRQKKSPGRPKAIPAWALVRLRQELQDPEGFESYEEVRTWLRAVLGIEASYKVVHGTVRYQLKAKLKVPRPQSDKHSPAAITSFKKKLPSLLKSIVDKTESLCRSFRQVRYWCQDETRLGLKTIQRRRLTLKGTKPIGIVQWERKTFNLYGIVEPRTGASFFFEFCRLDTICFEKFLELFSEAYPEDFHIIQLDNGAFHSGMQLQIPDNIILLFQPAHTPQVNPIERLWEEIKDRLSWELFAHLDELRVAVGKILQELSQKVIASITGWDFILNALSVAGI